MALKEEKVPVTSGKKKGQCLQGGRCSFRHEAQDRAQKPEHIAATLSEPTVSRGRSVSRKRSIRGKSNHGSILRQPCRYYLKGTCTRTPCEYWHPPECQFIKLETSVCSRIIRLMNNQTKSRRKATVPQKKRKRPQKNAVVIVIFVPKLSCVSQDSDALVSQRGKQSR